MEFAGCQLDPDALWQSTAVCEVLIAGSRQRELLQSVGFH